MATQFVVVSQETPTWPDCKVFGNEGDARRHAKVCLSDWMATSIFKVEAADARAAVAAVQLGEADLVFTQPGDPSPKEIQKREQALILERQRELLRDLGMDNA